MDGKREQRLNELKARLMSEPLLILPDLKKTFEVHCDACGERA